jgi:hypothetical protein
MQPMYAPANYAEVRIGGKRRLIEVLSDRDGIVKGYRANRDGSRWDHDDGAIWSQEVIVVSAANVLRRLKLDLMYGELVEPK